MINHFMEVDIEDRKFLVYKMNKGEYDNYERKYGNIDRSIKAMRLTMQKTELKEMLGQHFIDYPTFKTEVEAVEKEIEGLAEKVTVMKEIELEDGSKYETNVATYSIAEKLHLTVFEPEMKDGKIVENKKGEPNVTQYSVAFWITKCEETMFNKLSDLVDYMQMYGCDEPITLFDDIFALFQEEVTQMRMMEIEGGKTEEVVIPMADILERIANLKTEYATGEIYRKKSESAYGVRIHGMKSVRDVGHAKSTTSE